MSPFLLLSVLFFTTMPANSAYTLKQQAATAIKAFFQISGSTAKFQGHYVDTSPDYGQACWVCLEFSEPGTAFLTIRGEYTPTTSIGDGIYFDVAEDTFVTVTAGNDLLIIEQKLRDSFSTGTHTHMRLHKQPGAIEVTIRETKRFLMFSDTQTRRCVIPWE